MSSNHASPQRLSFCKNLTGTVQHVQSLHKRFGLDVLAGCMSTRTVCNSPEAIKIMGFDCLTAISFGGV